MKIEKWKEFELQELFEIKYGVNLELINLTQSTGSQAINFVSRTSGNNGVVAKVLPVEGIEPQEAGLISVASGGSVLSTFYQDEPFYSGRDLYILKEKVPMSKLTKLFLCTVLKKNAYRYAYGRQANKTLKNINNTFKGEKTPFTNIKILVNVNKYDKINLSIYNKG